MGTAIASGYSRREPEKSILHKLVRDNLETLLAESRSEDGAGLPAFVERELREYSKCGLLSEGFTLLRCTKCGEEIPVAFSCKTKICPSCAARRMHSVSLDLGARLPVVPYRHWVLSLPPHLRFLLARDERLLSRFRKLFASSVRSFLRRKAKALGVRSPLTGAIVFTQRFSSKLLLYPHFHAVVPDGAFSLAGDGKPVFHALRPSQDDVEQVAASIAKKAARLQARLDLDAQDPNDLDRLRARAAQGELALKLGLEERPPPRLLASREGFTLQAARHLHANDREGLAFLIRYNLRPPIALSRLAELPSGKVLLTFKRPLADGTAALELAPIALLRRLASLVPPPGAHDLSYFGIYSSHDAHRRLFVGPRRKDPDHCQAHPGLEAHDSELQVQPTNPDALVADTIEEERYVRWADLMRKVHGLEALIDKERAGLWRRSGGDPLAAVSVIHRVPAG